MGFFSEEHEHYVSSIAEPIIMGEGNLSKKDMVLYSILKNQSLSNVLISNYKKGLEFLIEKARTYAKDEYVLGLPNQSKSSAEVVNSDVLTNIVTTDLNLPYGCFITFKYKSLLYANLLVIPFLIKEREYSFTDNTISIFPDDWLIPETIPQIVIDELGLDSTSYSFYSNAVKSKVLLEKIIYTDDDFFVELHYSAYLCITAYRSSNTKENGVIHREYIIDYPTAHYQTTYIEIRPVPSEYKPYQEYYIVGYQKINELGEIEENVNWWYYLLGSGIYPEIEENIETTEVNNSYPVIPIRYDNTNINETDHPELYPSVCSILKKLELPLSNLTSALEENPNIADIDHAYLVFGINLQTNDPISLSYLMEFFLYLQKSDTTTIWNHLENYSLNTDYIILDKHGYNFNSNLNLTYDTHTTENPSLRTDVFKTVESLSLVEYGLSAYITYKSILNYSQPEVIGNIGDVTKEFVTRTYTHKISPPKGGPDYTQTINYYVLILKKQISSTFCQIIEVEDLLHINVIYNDRAVFTNLKDLIDDPKNNNFILPLNHSIVNAMQYHDKNGLYKDTLFLIINTHEEVTLEWYETGFFSFLVQAVGLIISAFTGQAWIMGLTEIIEKGIIAIIVCLIETVAWAIGLSIAASALVDLLGENWAFIVGMVLSLISVGNSFGMSFPGGLIPDAQTLLNLGPAMVQSANDKVNELLKDIGAEYEEFMIDAEAKQEILNEKYELLNKEYLLPFSYLAPPLERSEPDIKTSPDILYAKTHEGNIGVRVLDMIKNYTTIALTLPETTIK